MAVTILCVAVYIGVLSGLHFLTVEPGGTHSQNHRICGNSSYWFGDYDLRDVYLRSWLLISRIGDLRGKTMAKVSVPQKDRDLDD